MGFSDQIEAAQEAQAAIEASQAAFAEVESQAADWSIERDLELEEGVFHNTDSTGMSFANFAREWIGAVDRGPTQEEYENWIQFGNAGQVTAELSAGSGHRTGVSLSEFTGDEATEGTFDVYTANDLADLGGEFDLMNDGEMVFLPNEIVVSDQYAAVAEGEHGTLYQKQENAEWYENPVIAAAAGLAAGFVSAFVLGPGGIGVGASVAGAVGGTTGAIAGAAVVGAVTGAVGAGVSAELLGGDFWDAAGEGAVTGGAGGAVSGTIASFGDKAGTFGRAGIRFAGTAGAEFALDGDLEDALLSGGISAATGGIADDDNLGRIEELALTGAVGSIRGGTRGAVDAIGRNIARTGLEEHVTPILERHVSPRIQRGGNEENE